MVSSAVLALLATPTIASKRWAYEQYDTLVGSRTVRRAGAADAAVLQLAPDGGRGAIATTIDGNGRRVACDPYVGAAEAVLECARNLACVGAEPLGLTNCLNFGNPEKPHIAWQLTQAVRGLGDACRALGVPVVGGNVSLYNEGSEGPIYPTPVVGMVGSLPDPAAVPGMGFAEPRLAVALVGAFEPALAGSELEKLRGALASTLPQVDLNEQALALARVREAVRAGTFRSVHDVAEGGLAVALAECCIAGGIGARIDLAEFLRGYAAARGVDDVDRVADEFLFGEGPGGFVVTVRREAIPELENAGFPGGFLPLGETGGERLELGLSAASLAIPVADLATAFESGIPARFS